VVLIFGFLLHRFYLSWTAAKGISFHFSVGWLAGATLFCWAVWWLSALAWRTILAQLGRQLGILESYRAFTLSQMGKYAPGKVWMLVGRVWLAGQSGVPKRITFVSLMLETVLILITGALVGLTALSPVLRGGNGYLFLGLAIVVAVGAMFLHPRLFLPVVNLALRCLKKEPIPSALSWQGLLFVAALYFAVWFTMGAAFYAFVRALTPVPWSHLPLVTGVYALSWVSGFLAVFAPAGLGVREGMLAYLLVQFLPEPAALAAALASRVWLMGCEVLFVLAAWGMGRGESGEMRVIQLCIRGKANEPSTQGIQCEAIERRLTEAQETSEGTEE